MDTLLTLFEATIWHYGLQSSQLQNFKLCLSNLCMRTCFLFTFPLTNKASVPAVTLVGEIPEPESALKEGERWHHLPVPGLAKKKKKRAWDENGGDVWIAASWLCATRQRLRVALRSPFFGRHLEKKMNRKWPNAEAKTLAFYSLFASVFTANLIAKLRCTDSVMVRYPKWYSQYKCSGRGKKKRLRRDIKAKRT